MRWRFCSTTVNYLIAVLPFIYGTKNLYNQQNVTIHDCIWLWQWPMRENNKKNDTTVTTWNRPKSRSGNRRSEKSRPQSSSHLFWRYDQFWFVTLLLWSLKLIYGICIESIPHFIHSIMRQCCFFVAGVCYAEFGARVPKAGSAYVYANLPSPLWLFWSGLFLSMRYYCL